MTILASVRQLRMNISNTSVNFLDISISMTQHGLTTDIFYKDTDTNSYVRYEPAHPPSCKKGIPFSQFLRLRRICNNDQTFERRSDEMCEFFSLRGFPVNIIKNSLRKASKFTQSEGINKRKNLNNSGVPLTMKFSGITKCIAKTIKSNLSILSANHKTNRIFGTNSVFVALKRKRVFEIALFVPNSTVMITLLKHLALLFVIDHDATLAVTKLSAILLEAHLEIGICYEVILVFHRM